MTSNLAGAPVHIGATRDDVYSAAAQTVLEAAQAWMNGAPSAHGDAPSIVVSGGATTPALLRVIADSWPLDALPMLIPSDERWTTNLELSNARELASHLTGTTFESCPILSPNPHVDIEASAEDWSKRLAIVARPFIALLSMGDDGHVASLFPGLAVELISDSVSVCRNSPKPPATRLSLSLEFLRKVPMRLMFAIGDGKMSSLKHLNEGGSLPASQVEPTHWFIDEVAAQGLRR